MKFRRQALLYAVLRIAVVANPATVLGQIAGHVGTDANAPLGGVRVEVWLGATPVSATVSAADGSFAVGPLGAALAADYTVTFRRIGFQPQQVAHVRVNDVLTIALRPLPIQLAPALVEEAPSPPVSACRTAPSSVAEALFMRSLSRYRKDTRAFTRVVQVATASRVVDGHLRESMIGIPLGGDLRLWTPALRAPNRLSDTTAVPSKRQASISGTAWTVFGLPQLEAADATLFTTPDSLGRLAYSSPRTTPTGFVIGFCSTDRRVPYVSGELLLDSDTALVGVRWQFFTSSQAATIGGLAVFPKHKGDGEREHLLPAASVRWARIGGSERFGITEYSFGRWLVVPLGDPAIQMYQDSVRARRPR